MTAYSVSQFLMQVAPATVDVAKTAEAATKAAEAATKAAEAATKSANAANKLADSVPVLSAEAFASILVTIVLILTVIALALIYRNVRRAATWSLAQALSEDVPSGAIVKNVAGEPLLDKENNLQREMVEKASSSRLIALLGAVVIMMLYVGAGLAVLMQFTTKGTVPPDAEKFTTFFLYGMVLFAPYVVNKFASIFGWLK